MQDLFIVNGKNFEGKLGHNYLKSINVKDGNYIYLKKIQYLCQVFSFS